MKLCRLIDWLKGVAHAAPPSLVDQLMFELEEAQIELDRKEAVIQQLLERTKLAETMLIKYRRQRNQLKKDRSNP